MVVTRRTSYVAAAYEGSSISSTTSLRAAERSWRCLCVYIAIALDTASPSRSQIRTSIQMRARMGSDWPRHGTHPRTSQVPIRSSHGTHPPWHPAASGSGSLSCALLTQARLQTHQHFCRFHATLPSAANIKYTAGRGILPPYRPSSCPLGALARREPYAIGTLPARTPRPPPSRGSS